MALLGEMLVKEGLINKAQLDEAIQSQIIFGGRLGTNLIELGYVDEKSLGKVLAKKHNVPFIDPDLLVNIDAALLQKVPKEVAGKYKFVPFALDGKKMNIAMEDPSDLRSLDDISFKTGCVIKPHVTSELRLLASLERYYGIKRKLRYITLSREDTKQYRQAAGAARTAAAPGAAKPGGPVKAAQPKAAPPPPKVKGLEGLKAGEELSSQDDFERMQAQMARQPLGQPGAAQKPPVAQVAPPPGAPKPGQKTMQAPPLPPASRPIPTPPPAEAQQQPPDWQNLFKEQPAAQAPQPGPPAAARPAAPPPREEAAQPVQEILEDAEIIFVEKEKEDTAALGDMLLGALGGEGGSSLFGGGESAPAKAQSRTLNEVIHAIDTAFARDDISKTVLEFGLKYCKRCMLFTVMPQFALGLDAVGDDVNRDLIERIAIPFDNPSLFKTVHQNGKALMGPPPNVPLNMSFFSHTGGYTPKAVLLIPVMFHGKMVNIFYGDGGRESTIGNDVKDLLILTQRMPNAFESMKERVMKLFSL
ncbi:MAG: hypothetical protein PHT59_08030 [Candidatus Omnitrophica bacterium]|nr:hypothetical protein [Candidatus Omnitrophota bacterium]